MHITKRKHCSFDLSASELKKDLLDVGIDAGTHVFLLYQDNLSSLLVISAEQTTLSSNGEQVLKLTMCIGPAELNVKHTIKCLAGTRCASGIPEATARGAEAPGA